MNARQVAFYRQARSDWSIFRHFHPRGFRWWRPSDARGAA